MLKRRYDIIPPALYLHSHSLLFYFKTHGKSTYSSYAVHTEISRVYKQSLVSSIIPTSIQWCGSSAMYKIMPIQIKSFALISNKCRLIFLQFSPVRFWWVCAKTTCHHLLLWAIQPQGLKCFTVWDAFLLTTTVKSGCLSYHRHTVNSNQSGFYF